MEEKIYDRQVGKKNFCCFFKNTSKKTNVIWLYFQVTKLSLSCRVVDEQQIERRFNSANLNEMYAFEPDSHLRRPKPLIPKDRLLAKVTIQRKEWIITYHEHESLFVNKEEKVLTELESKAA